MAEGNDVFRAEPMGARRGTLGRVALLLLTVSLAIPSAAAAQRYPLATFTADEGLAGTQVWDLHLDSRGYLWIGTTWGLCRYDGESFTTFSVPEGLPSPTARTLLEDRDGVLWIGTNSGVARYDGRELVAIEDLAGLPRMTVWASAMDPEGRLWFGTERGLASFDGERFRAYGTEDGLPSEYVYALLASSTGELWVGTRGAGLARCRIGVEGDLEGCRLHGPEELGEGVVRGLAEESPGVVWVGTRGAGLLRFEGESVSRFTRADGLPDDDVYALLADGAGRLLVGTGAGLAICELPGPRSCRVLRRENGLRDDDVRALEVDGEGSVWIGVEGGLARLDRVDLWSYGVAEGLPGEHVYALAADRAGAVWAGTVGGLARLAPDPHGRPEIESFGVEAGLPEAWVWALAFDPAGRLWVGTGSGICRLEGRRCLRPLPDPPPWPGTIYALHFDRAGDLWVATSLAVARVRGLAGGVAPPRVEVFSRADGLAADRGYTFAEDAEGRLWIAHGEGLSYRQANRFHAVAESAAPVGTVRALATARDGTLWLGGYGHVTRLLELRPGAPPRFVSYGAEAGLADVQVLTLGDDEHGHLLLGTNRGVLLFDPRARQGKGSVLARFARGDGPLATEVSHSSAFARDALGRYWFGFKGGMTGFPAGLEPEAEPSPAVAIERLISRRGRLLAAPFSALEGGGVAGWLGSAPVELAPGDDRLRVEARALLFRRQRGLRYQFRLEGLDADWPEAVTEPFREFTNLAPGEYRLEVRAALRGGEWGEPAALQLTVRPDWWQRPPVRLAALLALVGLGAAGMGLRTRRVEARARELERRVAERTEDLARYARALAEHLATLDRSHARVRARASERDELLARLGHEVRTPLTSILGFSELLESAAAGRLNARELRFLANIRESGNHLLRLVNNLLDQAKLESGRMEVHLEAVALEPLLGSVASLMEGFAVTRGVRLETRVEPPLEQVETDVAKLRQIVLNLLSNAIKFSPPRGLVAIEARPLPEGEGGLGAAAWQLTVRDQGPGIGADDLERIFEPYRQAASRPGDAPGTGLGLPIARQLARLLGGRIEVDSQAGQGASFRALLPLAPQALLARVEEEERSGASPDLPRVLVIEPEPERFRGLARRLEPEGRLAVRAPDLEEARRMMRELEPAAVVLRLDPARPEGWASAAALERELARGGVPLLLLASAGDDERGWALVFDRVLAASADVEEVAQTVAGLIASEGTHDGASVVLLGGEPERRRARAAALAAAGLAARAPETAEAVLEELERESAAAVLVDPESALPGGLGFVRSLQREARGRALVWCLLLPGELPAYVRRAYADQVEGAEELAAADIAAALAFAEGRGRAARRAAQRSR